MSGQSGENGMDPAEELAVLRSIVSRARSATWWARLAYPDDPKFWTEQEQAALNSAYSGSNEASD